MKPIGSKLPVTDNVGVEAHILPELRAGALAHIRLLLPYLVEYRPQHGLFYMAQGKSNELLFSEKDPCSDVL